MLLLEFYRSKTIDVTYELILTHTVSVTLLFLKSGPPEVVRFDPNVSNRRSDYSPEAKIIQISQSLLVIAVILREPFQKSHSCFAGFNAVLQPPMFQRGESSLSQLGRQIVMGPLGQSCYGPNCRIKHIGDFENCLCGPRRAFIVQTQHLSSFIDGYGYGIRLKNLNGFVVLLSSPISFRRTTMFLVLKKSASSNVISPVIGNRHLLLHPFKSRCRHSTLSVILCQICADYSFEEIEASSSFSISYQTFDFRSLALKSLELYSQSAEFHSSAFFVLWNEVTMLMLISSTTERRPLLFHSNRMNGGSEAEVNLCGLDMFWFVQDGLFVLTHQLVLLPKYELNSSSLSEAISVKERSHVSSNRFSSLIVVLSMTLRKSTCHLDFSSLMVNLPFPLRERFSSPLLRVLFPLGFLFEEDYMSTLKLMSLLLLDVDFVPRLWLLAGLWFFQIITLFCRPSSQASTLSKPTEGTRTWFSSRASKSTNSTGTRSLLFSCGFGPSTELSSPSLDHEKVRDFQAALRRTIDLDFPRLQPSIGSIEFFDSSHREPYGIAYDTHLFSPLFEALSLAFIVRCFSYFVVGSTSYLMIFIIVKVLYDLI